jgi:hypothetical protein
MQVEDRATQTYNKSEGRSRCPGEISCEIVALWKNFVHRPESYDLNSAKSCVFIVHENMRTVLHLFPHFSVQSDQKNGMKKFSRHLSVNLISLLTSEIF